MGVPDRFDSDDHEAVMLQSAGTAGQRGLDSTPWAWGPPWQSRATRGVRHLRVLASRG